MPEPVNHAGPVGMTMPSRVKVTRAGRTCLGIAHDAQDARKDRLAAHQQQPPERDCKSLAGTTPPKAPRISDAGQSELLSVTVGCAQAVRLIYLASLAAMLLRSVQTRA